MQFLWRQSTPASEQRVPAQTRHVLRINQKLEFGFDEHGGARGCPRGWFPADVGTQFNAHRAGSIAEAPVFQPN